MKTIPYLIIALCITLAGCIDIEDNTNRVDSFECARKAKELGVNYRHNGWWCELYVNGDTVVYKYRQ